MKKVFLLLAVFASLTMAAQSAPEGLFIGSKAPDFKGEDQFGNKIKLKDVLKKGEVVLVFYRGQWCPYCNRELAALQDSLQFIKDKGATLIAISPETNEMIDKTIEKTKASYSIINDEGLEIMKDYDVNYEVPENTVTRYRNVGIDLLKFNGKNGNHLPIPAVYIIDQSSTVTYRFFEKNYRKRPSVKEIVSNLRGPVE